ncbi:hypothetical protein [Flavobacterium sp.]|uniref:hypothetical protein n=1 Tax=Flavobacterium sp. TaxID=239 RepID=UPI002624E60F|nr:hypothetical protein [Flavobacterium sp.]
MKNLVFNFAIALVVFSYFTNTTHHSKKESKATKNELVQVSKNNDQMVSTGMNFFEMEKSPISLTSNESKNRVRVSGNSLKNERSSFVKMEVGVAKNQSLDFTAIESLGSKGTEKTIDEVISEDNAIIESDLNNEVQSLDIILIKNVVPSLIGKTIDEVIAEDKAITESNVVTIAQPLNSELLYYTTSYVKIDNVAFDTTGKSIEEIIAEDNAITGN